MDTESSRIRERPVTNLHGGGGERIPADRETRYRGRDAARDIKE